MHSFFGKKTAINSLVSGALVASVLGHNLVALALPESEIVEIFRQVAVFTVADEQGAPLVAVSKDKDGKDVRLAGVFISREDANKFFEQLEKDKPDVAKQVKVLPVSLADIYKLSIANLNQPDALGFSYVPMAGEVEAAKTILSSQNQQYAGGVPLFAARGGEEGGFLTIQQGEEQIIPFFFEKKQLDVLVERFKQEKPELAATVNIDVIPLEGIIDTMRTQNDELLGKIRLIPTQETIQFIQSIQQPQQ